MLEIADHVVEISSLCDPGDIVDEGDASAVLDLALHSESEVSKLKMDEDICDDEDKYECRYRVGMKTGLGSGLITSLGFRISQRMGSGLHM